MLCSHSHRHYSWQILRILRENFTFLFAKTEGELHCIGKNVLSYLARVQTFLFQVPLLHHLIYIPKRTVSKRKKKFAHHINLFQLQRSRFASVFLWKKERNGQQLFLWYWYELFFGGIDCKAQMSFKTPPHLFLPDVLITRTMEKEY